MTQSIHQLVMDLKQNEQDFEFYPTTDEMLAVISPYMSHEQVLDIGCGLCGFKKFMDKRSKIEWENYYSEQKRKEREAELRGERHYYNKSSSDFYKIDKYFVMEKSKILLEKLDEDAICLGTDFIASTLIDKKVSTIFCNPPYSEFKEWTKKIITEGNYKQAFLVIPQRWKDDKEINLLLETYRTEAEVIGSFDFLEADRVARAKVDVIRLRKNKYKDRYSYDYRNQEDFDRDSFDTFFNQVFGIDKTFEENQKDRNETEYSRERRIEDAQKERVKNALISTEESKAATLVKLYNKDYETLLNNLQAIMKLDEDILESFNISVKNIKEALITKMKGLKVLYWNMVWDEFEEITDRLTWSSREKIRNEFRELYCVDFTIENIYALILWVVKNANKYYNSQLIEFYKKLSDEQNVKPYKSNQKLFEKDGWYWNAEKHSNYVLDYRIIMSSPFRTTWNGAFEDGYDSTRTLQDIMTIARNLGFNTGIIRKPNDFGEKVNIYMSSGAPDVFMEYKAYKNGNMHVKFSQEFTKAMNVEVARLLGWIRCKEDIKREFPDNMSKGAEKYFKVNYACIGCNTLMITTKG